MRSCRSRHPSDRPGQAGRPVLRRLHFVATPAWLLLTVCLGAASGRAEGTSLRFFGTGSDDADRVKIRIDEPARRADVGAADFTLEWWMKALPGENASTAAACDTNGGWITGNIVFDRDVWGDGDHGDFGVSLTGGRIAFGVSAGNAGNTICGVSDVTDGAWHHVAVTRRRSDGRLRIYVDGLLDAEGPGNTGEDRDVSYRNGRLDGSPTGADPFLVIGAGKHDMGPHSPSYRGWIDEVRLSKGQRYTGDAFTLPSKPFKSDTSTLALYHFDEGSGELIRDASRGRSHGSRRVGGAGEPEWSSESPPFDPGGRVALQQVVSGLTRPVAIAHAGDGRLFVVDAHGQILAYQVDEQGGALIPRGTFLDIWALVQCCGEEGLLGLAFHPEYRVNGYFFVYYTNPDGNHVLARYRVSGHPDAAEPGSARILMTIDHPTHANHNGGALAFGPDGYLYVGVGDGGGGGDAPNNAQNVGTRLGKLLRLDVDVEAAPYYAIPATNPFAGSPGPSDEIWAYGLRNPWRIAFDRRTGDLFIADVGQNAREEVNVQPRSEGAGEFGGRNYGWRRMEGKACYEPSSGCQTGTLVLPILDYGHSEGCSVTGGYRYRAAGVPALYGVYVFGDFCSGRIWGAFQSGTGAWSRSRLLDTDLLISTFGEDAAGELYVADMRGGRVYRFVRPEP
jgi:glucose/arabinose dehydrogenase